MKRIIAMVLILLGLCSTAFAVVNTRSSDPCIASWSMGTWTATIGEDINVLVVGINGAYSGQTSVLTALNLPPGFIFTQGPNEVNVIGFVVPDGVLLESQLDYIASWPYGAVYGIGHFRGKATALLDWEITFVVTAKTGAKFYGHKRLIIRDTGALMVTP